MTTTAKKILAVAAACAVVFVLGLLSACYPGDVYDPAYFEDLLPNAPHTGNVGTAIYPWANAWIDNINGAPVGPGGIAHNILSATHTDATAAAVVRGDLITGQGLVATWTRLARGGAGMFLVSDGMDLLWRALVAADIPVHDLLSATHSGTAAAVPVRGDIITGQGVGPTWTRLGVGAAGTYLKSDGTDVGWAGILNGDLPASISVTSLTASSLTAGRVIFAGVGGLLTDDADLTFLTDTLTTTKLSTTQITNAGTLAIQPSTAQDVSLWGGTAGTSQLFTLIGTDADAGNTLRDSPSAILQARYWTGAANTAWNYTILNDMQTAGATPQSTVLHSINTVAMLSLVNNNSNTFIGFRTDSPTNTYHFAGRNFTPVTLAEAWTSQYRFQTRADIGSSIFFSQGAGSPSGLIIQGASASDVARWISLNPFGSNIGIGMLVPTARLHLAAGTTAVGTGPLKFTSGPLLTTPEAGSVEFLADALYFTITTGPTRKTFAFLESPAFTGNISLASTGKFQSATGVIGFSVNSSALTLGSAGSVVIPYGNMSGAADDAARDVIAGNVNGATAVDSGDPGRIYYRANGGWYYYDATP